MSDEHEQPPHRPSRRALIGGAITGATAAWVAPTILSIDAAAAFTCTNFNIDWGDYSASVNNLGTSPFTVPLPHNTEVLVSYSNAGMSAGAVDQVGYALTTPLGTQVSNFIELAIHVGNPPGTVGVNGDYVELTFAFQDATTLLPKVVTDVGFMLLDIDLSAGAWTDEVDLYALAGASPIHLAGGDATVADPFVVSGPTPVGTHDDFVAIGGPVAGGANNGNVGIVYSTPIDTLTLRYIANNGIDQQQIGVFGLSGCV